MANSSTTADQVDRQLVSSALTKARLGQTPTSQERSALARWEKAKDDEARWAHYRSIPQKHWREMSGRQAKVLIEQAQRYGIPFDGATVDLTTVVRKLHDYFAEHARSLPTIGAAGDGDESQKDRKERIKADREELKLEYERGNLIPRDEIHVWLAEICAVIRAAGDRIQRDHGPEAHAVIEEALDSIEKKISAAASPEAA